MACRSIRKHAKGADTLLSYTVPPSRRSDGTASIDAQAYLVTEGERGNEAPKDVARARFNVRTIQSFCVIPTLGRLGKSFDSGCRAERVGSNLSGRVK